MPASASSSVFLRLCGRLNGSGRSTSVAGDSEPYLNPSGSSARRHASGDAGLEVGAEHGSENIASLSITPSPGECWSYPCWAAGWSASEEMVSLLPGASSASASAQEDMEAQQSQHASSVADARGTEAVREWMYSRSYLCVLGCQSGPPSPAVSVLDARHLRRIHHSASATSQKKPIIATTAPIIPPVVSLSGELESAPW